jgi:prephenate dehydrogenase
VTQGAAGSAGGPLPGSVAILGLGLIGGSLALDLRALGVRVVGWDRPAVLRQARRRRLVDVAARTAEEAARGVELVVLAAPPAANLRLLALLAGLGSGGPVVTDVGSVKRPIVAEAERLGLRRFVGGHPLAGTERSGIAAARPGLFAGRAWVLTPGPGTQPRASRLVGRLARALGARPVRRMEASEHDRAVAFLSHLPQVVAWALLAAAQGDPVARRHLALAGPGFRDMTRLARSPRGLWREILAQNAGESSRALRALQRALARRP